MPLVAQGYVEAGIQERELAQTALKNRKIEIGVGEGTGARLEVDLGAMRPFARADLGKRSVRLAVLEADVIFAVLCARCAPPSIRTAH